MLRHLSVRAFVITLMIPLGLSGAAWADDRAPHVTVTGEGRATAVPDMATVHLGVAHEAREARDAMAQVNEDIQKLFAALTEMGIAPRDVQTSSLRLDPVWRDRSRSTPPETPVIDGFVAQNDLTIRVSDMARLGDVLAVMLDSGSNRFSGISFGLRDPGPVLDEARRLAVADARARAQLYADAAGVTLGDISEIFEPGTGSAPGPVFARAEAMMVGDGMPVAAGELNFNAQITIVYGLEN
ncbi:SIMPL domain-containing protein [Marinovum sp. 2_MG-2023]|uniref:SIMPL domain-containing protein n=1 Tax=unclassified Marinovum TaxID=2647166 RepID=UPI0026E1579A|nr:MULTISPECIES: SIMPL domain-containing protein [unclassified Marinovum]MDO6729379.1 SIMPL domain-containing protein [Marinovum sp. 2_MG-2023]